MQFYTNGYKPGDPFIEAPHPSVAEWPEGLPEEADVLIIGCGPAGLVLAAQLANFPDIKTVVIDRKDGPLEVGQADGVACRTVELLEAFGLADRLVNEGYWVNEVAFWRPDQQDRARITRTGRIQDVEDAKLAVASGADALIVSNHGGRQLDGAQSSIEALPSIVQAVGSQIEVHMDGGIRSGQDVLKAWALGARGTYIGRAHLYGLGAMGEAGVSKALEIIRNELDLTMAFCGRTRIEQVDQSILLPGSYPGSP